MPITSLKLIPTVNAEATPTLNEAGISSCNLIRFKAKLPQKLGGWTKFYANNLGSTARDLHAWQDLSANDWLGYAATGSVTTLSDDVAYTISPQTKTTDFTPDFDTTNGSAIVLINDPNIANVTAYDSILFKTPIAVGGLILQGIYEITAPITTTEFQITASSNATSSVTAGGAVPSFATTSGSPIITVTLTNHGLAVDDQYTFLVSTTVGGTTIF
jgi:hypothetical protein